MRLQHIFKQLSEEMAEAAAPPAQPKGEYGYGDLDKVLGKIEEALQSHAGKHSGVVVLDFGEPAVQMDLSVSKTMNSFSSKNMLKRSFSLAL